MPENVGRAELTVVLGKLSENDLEVLWDYLCHTENLDVILTILAEKLGVK